jgi:serine/threonine protein kinase
LHQVGVGALGPVFRTYEPTRDRLVAIKVFRLDVTPEQARALADELSAAAEAGLFHPSIVEPIAAGVEGTVAYRADEYVAAETLDVAMRHYAPAPIDKVMPFITQLAGAIDFARAAGVGHGALHPRDVFVTPEEARASGFGVVDALERVGLRAPVRRPYTAPERVDGQPWGTPADVFSLAVIAYELLTGRRPSGTGVDIGPLTGTSIGASVERLQAVLARAMDANPARRYPTALAFAGAIEESTSPEPVSVAAAAPAIPIAPAAMPPKQPVAATLEPVDDDIKSERDVDEAHHELTLRERDRADLDESQALTADAHRASEPEAESDRLFIDAVIGAAADSQSRYRDDDYELTAPTRESDPELPELAEAPPARPVVSPGRRSAWDADRDRERLSAESQYDYRPAAAVVPAQGSRMLPLAAMLSIGLLVGFAVGYGVGSRGPAVEPSAAEVTGSKPEPAPSGAKPYSEQAVAPQQTPARQPPSTLPPVASESPTASPPGVATATTGRIEVRSTPPKAGVTVNGRWRGRTPLSIEKLPFGQYSVRIVQPGYVVAREDFTLTGEDSSRTLSVRLQPETTAPRAAPQRPAPQPAPAAGSARPAPAEQQRPGSYTGSIYVDSRPRGAQVFVDGRAVGTTPLSVPDVAIGSHVVRLELSDHRSWSVVTRVSAGRQERVTGSLERIQ